MKVIKLTSENIKKITAIEIQATDGLITIGGKNNAGKSSVLDSIAYALGGTALVPPQPIRAGESEAKITMDLGDLVVTRRFYRDRLVPKDASLGELIEAREQRNTTETFGPTKSVLTVVNKEGARYPSPQAVLDKLVSSLAFDPLAFAHAESKQQHETLRRLVNLDFSDINNKRTAALERRTLFKKYLEDAKRELAAHVSFPNAGLELVSMTEFLQEVERINRLGVVATAVTLEHEKAEVNFVEAKQKLDWQVVQLARLKSEVAQLELDIQESATIVESCGVTVLNLQKKAYDARKAVPNAEALVARMAEIEEKNRQVQVNQEHVNLRARVEEITANVTVENRYLLTLQVEKEERLSKANFPVQGLGLSDDGVTLNGVPFEQASSSEQLRVSVMIGLALNPTLRVLLVRNGNLLDDDALKTMAEIATKAEAQIWMEYVTSDANKVGVMIEEGHLANS